MSFENSYSWIDRTLHRLAFATRRLQLDFAENEDRSLGSIAPPRPLFITGLPRAGTTLLLDRFAGLDQFATHTYRDMPFVLVPLMWQRISKGFQQADQARERAHGDGMLVSTDSPEAFEEMLWLALAPERYAGVRLAVSAAPMSADVRRILTNHFAKIILLRGGARTGVRYVSKNNLNVARIATLADGFPDADFVVPFRAPLEHAASLLRQHRNFLAVHAQDDFARRYMAGVGHFDFGANLKPINFDGWLDAAPPRDPLTLDFWLAYWCAAYRHLLDTHGARVIFVGHAALCAEPERQLGLLAQRLGLEDSTMLTRQADAIKATTGRTLETTGVDDQLLATASVLHQRLLAAALGASS